MHQQEINKSVAQGLNELFTWFTTLKQDVHTKVPSVNIKQTEAIEVVKRIDYITSLVGYKNRVVTNEDGSISVILEANTEKALEELNNLTKEIGQEL